MGKLFNILQVMHVEDTLDKCCLLRTVIEYEQVPPKDVSSEIA